ncbi:MAG: ferritin-like domain-containing protein [Planctomycetaceae bacterium]|nr:ferritin-like domain-containing protein [Planctomycetaceae bacterium]
MLDLQHQQLAEQFQDLLTQEQQVEGSYAAMAARASDPEIRTQLESIRTDKQRHIELIQRLLEIVA